eukprot:CAMPEP_0167754346 /NCGR_PEP_ID=MMETSP0110_2-20121227/8218_1 /TAXON_ID=629695 /ORGANISM="Gymnochlora sp., Strain CCMP2014" /LENGTH=457 /DNA_ID=CAMNT_0007640213 /DNA_START=93 /DNA_END=1466 /DNA_ORIENTATION=+
MSSATPPTYAIVIDPKPTPARLLELFNPSNKASRRRKFSRRRKRDELMENERRYCPYGCGKFYRKTSHHSIQRHLQTCELKDNPTSNSTAATALKTAKASWSASASSSPLSKSSPHRSPQHQTLILGPKTEMKKPKEVNERSQVHPNSLHPRIVKVVRARPVNPPFANRQRMSQTPVRRLEMDATAQKIEAGVKRMRIDDINELKGQSQGEMRSPPHHNKDGRPNKAVKWRENSPARPASSVGRLKRVFYFSPSKSTDPYKAMESRLQKRLAARKAFEDNQRMRADRREALWRSMAARSQYRRRTPLKLTNPDEDERLSAPNSWTRTRKWVNSKSPSNQDKKAMSHELHMETLFASPKRDLVPPELSVGDSSVGSSVSGDSDDGVPSPASNASQASTGTVKTVRNARIQPLKLSEKESTKATSSKESSSMAGVPEALQRRLIENEARFLASFARGRR